MSAPDDRHEMREPRFPAERLFTQFTPHERGLAAAALAAFLGITYFGPALARLTKRKSRARKLREAAQAKARRLRRRADEAKRRAQSAVETRRRR